MKYSDCDYVLTGTTGILGSHVLYELLKKCLEGEITGKLILLTRSSKTMSAQQRIEKLFDPELIPAYLREYTLDEIFHWIRVVETDLKRAEAAMDSLSQLTQKAVFIHMASLVDLGTKESTRIKIYENNYLPTKELLHRCKDIMAKFVFISTAFASGEREGLIGDSFLSLPLEGRKFRNHYERLKMFSEHEVSRLCQVNNIPFQILRPSIICGRLMDPPYFVIPKFLTFYLFGEFFYTMKSKRSGQGIEKVRISFNDSALLNIIPVDYSAKAIVRAMERADITEMNIVNSYGIGSGEIIEAILQFIEYMNYALVHSEPEEKNHYEELYYKVIGDQFNNYIHGPSSEFDTALVNSVMKDMPMPDIRQNLTDLLSYAYRHKFVDTI